MHKRAATTVFAAILLTACGSPETAEAPPVEASTDPLAESAASETGGTDLASYVGQNASDGFLADPAVLAALDASVTDMETRTAIQQMGGPAMQVMEIDGRIAASQCEEGNCADRNYAVHIDPATGQADVCYFDASAGEQSTWYMAGGTTEQREGGCTVG